MAIEQLAREFTDMLRRGEHEAAGAKFWSDGIVSLENMPGEMARLQGRRAVMAKGDWWNANHTVHTTTVEGPFLHGDQFAVRFMIDVTPKGGARQTMNEIGLYTVRDGRIVEERFFY